MTALALEQWLGYGLVTLFGVLIVFIPARGRGKRREEREPSSEP